jgi:hypothetical protein
MKLAQKSFEELVSESKKASGLTASIVKNVTAPLNENFSFEAARGKSRKKPA